MKRSATEIRACHACGSTVGETKLGRTGNGPLTELRCPKCKVLFYIERRVWEREMRRAQPS